MRLAITVGTNQDTPELDRRFGRCAHFVIVDTESRDLEILANPAVEASGGAGPQAAQFLASQGVDAIVSGEFGPNAFTALEAAGIHMYSSQGGKVDQLVDDFLADRLARATTSSRQRHRGGRGQGGRRRR